MGKNLLVAVDDSENALRAVEFVADFFTSDNNVTLFSVVQDTATLCEMNSPELTPYFTAQQSSFCLLEDKKKELVNEALQKAKDVLMEAGFDGDKITIKLELKKRGVARDIINEAKSGYDAIVMGRRGLAGVKDFILGTISQKVFSAAKDISVVFVN